MTQYAGETHPYSAGPRADYTWSARFTVAPPLKFSEVVLGRLGSLVTRFADPEWPISGAVVGSGEDTDRTTLVLGLDPSRSFGTPTVERCEEIASQIATQGWQREPQNVVEMRIIMGRRIGYAGQEYTKEDVGRLLTARGCGELSLTPADLFSLRYVDGLREYHEPGVIIEGPADSLDKILQVAAEMGQERLVPEITGVATQVYFQNRG